MMPLPASFKPFFWDCDFAALSWNEHARFIAERVLVYGRDDDVRWIEAHADSAFIRDLVATSRVLDAKTRNYWELVLNGRHQA